MKHLRVKNHESFQHYKLRSPPWIKLHREILNDYAFCALADATKAHLMLIWVLAAGNNGLVPADPTFLASRIGSHSKIDLKAIIDAGFLIPEGGEDAPEIAPPAPVKPRDAERAARREKARAILAFLNEKTGKAFRDVASNLEPIMARLQDFDELTLRSIIIHRCQLWGQDEKMAEFLRPSTLFRPSNCANYAGEVSSAEPPA